MSHKSNSSGRILQPEIPPPSTYPENPAPPPLTLVPMDPLENDGPVAKGFWLFRRNTHNRAGPKNVSPKRAGVIAPSLERSWSEPNSPTEPTGSGLTGRDKSESKSNYITMAGKLLEETKVRFYGNMKAWDEFNERFKNLFANGRPAGGKLVKPQTPIHGAQAAARSIVEDIQAALDAMDQEMLVDDSSISTVNVQKDVRPPPTLAPEPWFDPSTVNPVILDKVKKHRSINPIGTWHGHSRSRSTTIARAIPDFALLGSKGGIVGKTDQAVIPPTADTNGRDWSQAQEKEVEQKEERWNQEERGRGRGKVKAKEVEHGPGAAGYGNRERDTSTSREPERGRRDRSRNYRGDIPFVEYPSRPEPPSRERQSSDPAVYTRSSYRRPASPDSLAPAVYTLVEDVEVRDGNSSTENAGERNLAGIGTPRAPTIVNYPDENATYGNSSPSVFPAGPSTRTDLRVGGIVTSPLYPVAEIPRSGVPTSDSNTGHRSRRRSRSLDHELNGRTNRERPRSRSPRDRPRTRDKDKDKDRERERIRDKGRERDDRDRDRNRDRDRDKGKDKERDRDRDRQRDREREREKGNDRDRDRERDQDKEHDREKGKDKDKERERGKDKGKYGSTRTKYLEGEQDLERWDAGGRRDKDRDRDRDRDKPRDRDRDKDKERDRDTRSRDKDKKKDRDRDRDRYRDRDYKDCERNDDHNRSGHERPTNPTPSPLANTNFALSDVTTAPIILGAYHNGSIPLGSTIPSEITPPSHSTPRTIFRSGVPTNGPLPPKSTSESRFMEILTSPVPPMPFNLPGHP